MSEEQEYDLFCTHCGQRITKDTTFCPSCGMQVSGEGEPQVNNNNNYNRFDNRYQPDRSGRLMFLSVVFAISAVLFIGLGIYYYANVDSIINSMVADPSWPDLVKMMADYGYTEQQFIDLMRSSLTITAWAFIISGIAIAIPAICGFTKKLWALGLICCIIATIATSVTLLGLIVGIIFSYMYATTKPCFNN